MKSNEDTQTLENLKPNIRGVIQMIVCNWDHSQEQARDDCIYELEIDELTRLFESQKQVIKQSLLANMPEKKTYEEMLKIRNPLLASREYGRSEGIDECTQVIEEVLK